MKYFSDCILTGATPEPDGEEGFADVRVLEGILNALRTGTAIQLEPFSRSRRIDTKAQREMLAAVSDSGPGAREQSIPECRKATKELKAALRA